MNQAAAPEPGARARRGDFGVCNCKASDTIMIAQPASERPLTSNALAVTAARTASTTNASGIPRIVPIATSSGLVRTTPQFTAKLKSTLAPVCAPSRSCMASLREYDFAGTATNGANDYDVSIPTYFSALQAKLVADAKAVATGLGFGANPLTFFTAIFLISFLIPDEILKSVGLK